MNNVLVKKWEKGFIEVGLPSSIREDYLIYIEKLIENNVPIIFDFQHLAKLLGRTQEYLAAVVNHNTAFYRDFSIPKRSGGERSITAPYISLMECQDWIYKNILQKIKIHPSAQGFAKKKSIITNAKFHVNEAHFLKVDIENFFPSISIAWVISIFLRLGYTHKVAFYLASLCTYEGYLPQGAPTSPMISNIVAINLDKRLLALAKKFKLKYTRYADDLAFSGLNIPVAFLGYVTNVINSEGFNINEKKTFISKTEGKRILTGISIADKQIMIPRVYRRELKQELFYIKKHGYNSHVKKLKIKQPGYLFSLVGKVRFWLSVEPANEFAITSLSMLNNLIESEN